METNTINNETQSLEVENNKLTSYEDLVAMVTQFQEQLQSLDYRVTNKNFGSKFYQTKEVITSKARFVAGADDDVVIMDAQHPLYRLWVGAADPTAAPFLVDKNGNVTLTSVTLSGYIPTGGALTDIGAGNITGTYIASGSITTPKLSATAIDGMTITGALIRTSSSGARVQMNDSTDALEVYDTGGTKRVVLDTDEITFLNSGGATRGGIIANTTEVYVYALNGGNLHLESEGSLYGVLIYANAAQVAAFTTAGLGMDNNITMNNNDIMSCGNIEANDTTSDIGTSAIPFDNLHIQDVFFAATTSNPTTDGQMRYYNSGGTEGIRCQFGGTDFQFDATAV